MTSSNHKQITKRIVCIFALLALVAGSVLPAVAQQRRRPSLRRASRQAPAPARYHTINAGQTIRVRMNERISSENARIGDRFTTTVVDPVYASGVEVIPAGSIVVGRVTEVKKAARKSKAGSIGVEFISLKLPNGSSRALNGSLTNLSNENVNYDDEGQVTGSSSRNRNIVFIGGGAAAGALIGAIAGGGKGAGIGAGVGAGIGIAGAYFSKGKEAVVKPGTEFGVILNQRLSLPATNYR
ncbi:MAG: hypothetical protein H7Y30_15145 [Pyrinomonadaceae bacterium]|nr:hypothetical protein [Pyrinomonadaceae bacterium]